MNEFKIGSAVMVTAGKEKGLLFAVVGFSGERLLICDGRTRRLNTPKTKSVKHVEGLDLVLPEQCFRSNKELRRALTAISETKHAATCN